MQDEILWKLRILERRFETEADEQTPGSWHNVKNIIIIGVNSLDQYVLKYARVLNMKRLVSARKSLVRYWCLIQRTVF
jgi:hypothetical protein